jgi:hypothetical protein
MAASFLIGSQLIEHIKSIKFFRSAGNNRATASIIEHNLSCTSVATGSRTITLLS